MKLANYVYVCLAALLAAGCNNGIFIDDIRLDVSEVTLDGNGDRYVVSLPKDNTFDGVSVNTSSSVNLECTLYDADGNESGWLSGNVLSLPGLGKMELYNDMLAFSLERTSDALILSVDENTLPAGFDCTLHLYSEYVSHDISLAITPCDRYVLDEFNLAASLTEVTWTDTEEQVDRVALDNKGNGVASVILHPYRDARAEVQFEFFYSPAYLLLSEPVMVDIPRDFGYDPQFVGDKVELSPQLQILPSLVDPETVVEMQVTPKAFNVFSVTVTYRKMYMWYEMRMHNPRTGRERTVKDVVWIREPAGYDVQHSILATYD